MNKYFLILTLFFCTHCYSNSIKKQNLITVWEDTSNSKENRADALQKLIKNFYLDQNPDSAIKYSHILLDLSKKDKDKVHESIAHNLLGLIALDNSNFKGAKKHFKNGLKLNQKLKDDARIVDSYNNLGNVEFYAGNSKQALKNYQKALQKNDPLNDQFLKSTSYNSIADVYYFHLSDFDEALSNYLLALESITDKKEHRELLLSIYNNLGRVSIALAKSDDALLYLKQAIKASKSKKDLAKSYRNIAYAYQQQREYVKAEKYFYKSLNIAIEKNYNDELINSYKGLYEHYKGISNFKKSLEMFEKYSSLNFTVNKVKIKDVLLKQKYEYDYRQKSILDSLSFKKKQEIDQLQHSIQLEKESKTKFILVISFLFIILLLMVYLKYKSEKTKLEKQKLIQQIKLLRTEALLKQKREKVVSESDLQITLNKDQIEAKIKATLNQSDWQILNEIYNSPTITNKEIATNVNLSVAGVRSSLQKMYRLFNINTSTGEPRLSLIIEAAQLSN